MKENTLSAKKFVLAFALAAAIAFGLIALAPSNQAVSNAIGGQSTSAYASSVKLSKSKVTIKVDKKVTLKVKGTYAKVKWSSSKKSVASVKKGVVTAKKVGTAIIKAKVNGKTLKCKVTVKKGKWSAKSCRKFRGYMTSCHDTVKGAKEALNRVTASNEEDYAEGQIADAKDQIRWIQTYFKQAIAFSKNYSTAYIDNGVALQDFLQVGLDEIKLVRSTSYEYTYNGVKAFKADLTEFNETVSAIEYLFNTWAKKKVK